jgi:hypothetical protein
MSRRHFNLKGSFAVDLLQVQRRPSAISSVLMACGHNADDPNLPEHRE